MKTIFKDNIRQVTYAPQNRPSQIGNRQLGFKQSSTTTKLENRVPHKSTCHCDEVVELIMSRPLAVGCIQYGAIRGSVNYPLKMPRIMAVEKV